MSENIFENKFNQIIQDFKKVPSNKIKKLDIVGRTAKNREVEAAVERLKDSLDYLRLNIKYLLFDLEATRRENEQLAKLIDELNK